MGWMKEAAMLISDARANGITLELGDLERKGDSLVVKGGVLPTPAEMEIEWGAWLEATYDPDNERLEDRMI